ncbi:MAG: hypothetical protein ACQEP5_05750 [Actinomycetota bacterium]
MKIEEKYSYGGWNNCIRMANDEVELVATTDVGPRIVRFGFIGGQNLFREFKQEQGKTGGDEWRIYGGHRLWHGPEASPRCYFPDNRPVGYEIDGDTLTLTQGIETTTGMQKQIEITLSGDNHVRLLHRIINHNLWDISFAPWSITVMNLKGRAIVPQEPYQSWEERLTPVRPLVMWGYTNMSDPRWTWSKRYIQLRQDPGNSSRQKLGILNTLGWMAYCLGGQVFIKRYGYDPCAAYTDFGVNTEIYTDADILETETLGSYGPVCSGGCAEHTENWYLFKADVGNDDVSIDKNILPLTEEME